MMFSKRAFLSPSKPLSAYAPRAARAPLSGALPCRSTSHTLATDRARERAGVPRLSNRRMIALLRAAFAARPTECRNVFGLQALRSKPLAELRLNVVTYLAYRLYDQSDSRGFMLPEMICPALGKCSSWPGRETVTTKAPGLAGGPPKSIAICSSVTLEESASSLNSPFHTEGPPWCLPSAPGYC
jgi:hypothetical protein